MNASSKKGNNPELWEKLLQDLDDKLQLGLLNHLRRIASYHFEDNTLFIAPSSVEDKDYLSRSAVHQQLVVFASSATGVEKVVINEPENLHE